MGLFTSKRKKTTHFDITTKCRYCKQENIVGIENLPINLPYETYLANINRYLSEAVIVICEHCKKVTVQDFIAPFSKDKWLLINKDKAPKLEENSLFDGANEKEQQILEDNHFKSDKHKPNVIDVSDILFKR